ncbi:MAG: C1 family peptidase [Bacteroidales bacterium]
MKLRTLFLAAATLCMLSPVSFASNRRKKKEEKPEYKFEIVVENPITSVKDQASSGTCWCYSGIGFLESEIIKAGGPSLDLSEMYIVSNSFKERAVKYVRMYGIFNYSEGSSCGDVLNVWKNHGIVPQTEMEGLNYGESRNKFSELSKTSKAFLDVIAKKPNRRLSTAWKTAFNGIIDAYLGVAPETFTYEGKEYTPKSFAESLNINMDDYVSITSFTHHPFYTSYSIQVPDNWRNDISYNVPIKDMMAIMDNALNNGYTICWGADVSERGFSRNGVGVIPDTDKIKDIEESGSDEARWIGVSKKKINAPYLSMPCPELTITQEMRQEAYDRQETTDDHGMQIYGIAKDQNGTKYYLVKNSWNTAGKYKGIWYVSEAFVEYKTMNFIVNKNAIPTTIKEKLGL